MTKPTAIKLRIPPQDLPDYPLFPLEPGAARQWAEGLPLTNGARAAQFLLPAVSDLNRVEQDPQQRFAVLEALRPSLLQCAGTLERLILNQPVILPDENERYARLCQRLYRAAITGYSIVALHALQRRGNLRDSVRAGLVGQSLHRALALNNLRLLQTLQLRRPPDEDCWLSQHQLYALAERHNLHQTIVTDPLLGNSTITQIYLRGVLLGASKANELSQQELGTIYQYLEGWAGHAEIVAPTATTRALLQVNLQTDRPPVYTVLTEQTPQSHHRLVLTEQLVQTLETLLRARPAEGPTPPRELLQHLLEAWGEPTTRRYSRQYSTDRLWLSIGFSNAHFYVAEGVPFQRLCYGSRAGETDKPWTNPFLTTSAPPRAGWDQAVSQAGTREAAEGVEDTRQLSPLEVLQEAPARERFARALTEQEKHPCYPVRMLNTSPNGYCVEWSRELPGDIHSGDLLVVREDGSRDWVVAVIRWVSQLAHEDTIIGLELLGPRAQPFGARIQRKTGEAPEVSRVLLMPAVPVFGQDATLVTPRSGFRENQKVTLLRDGEERLVHLEKQVSATTSFAQFTFRPIQHLEEVVADQPPPNMDFKSLWDDI